MDCKIYQIVIFMASYLSTFCNIAHAEPITKNIITHRNNMEQMPLLHLGHSFWHRTLYAATNGTGVLSRDPAVEALIRQVFKDNVRKDLEERNKVLGLAVLDPVWLFPIGPVRFRKKGILKGTLTACDLRLHNLKVWNPFNVLSFYSVH